MITQRTSPPVPGWMVLVGINDYIDEHTHPPLRCCVGDAIGLYVLLTHPAYGNFAPEHACLFLDGTDREVHATARAVVQQLAQDYGVATRPDIVEHIVQKRLFPIREDILAAIHRAAHYANPEDLLLVHFAGHGSVFDGVPYLIPPRARHPIYVWTAMALSQVTEMLQRSRARHKLLLLDACYAGPALGHATRPGNAEVTTAFQAATDNVAVLASCLPWEQSFEQDDALHGIFTLSLLEGLSGRADTGQPGSIALGDLYRYVDGRVKTWITEQVRRGPLQTPNLNGAGRQHAHCVLLSGDRRQAPACGVEEQSDVPEDHEGDMPPLEIRVWAQLADRRLTPVPRQGHTLPTFQIGQRLCLGWQASHDAELYLLNVDTTGRVIQLLPSGTWPRNLVCGGQTYVIPTEHDTVDLPVSPPPGVETLIAIAIRCSGSSPTAPPRAIDVLPLPPHPLSEDDLTRLAQRLSPLPRQQWAVGQYQFVVRERNR